MDLKATPEIHAILARDLVQDVAGRTGKLIKALDVVPRSGNDEMDTRLTIAAALLDSVRTELMCWQTESDN